MRRKLSEGSNLFKSQNINIAKWTKLSTGFSQLDNVLDGGLSAGLCCIGGVPSLGKSTFVTQMAEAFAKQKFVLIFSLEMDTENLGAKSVSRQLFRDNKTNKSLVKSSSELMNPQKISTFSSKEWSAIANASEAIEKINKRIEIIESDDTEPCSANWVYKTVDAWRQKHGEDPVVIIDYLQILAPTNSNASDKQNVDKSLETIKKLSKSLSTPVIAISSFGRDSYETEVNLKSFKDSGSIEYTADTLIGLQYTGVGTPKFSITKASSQKPRKIDVVMLKQRNGRSGIAIPYRYYPENNFFEEINQRTLSKMTLEDASAPLDIDYDVPCT